MLNYLSKDGIEKKYRAILLDYCYRNILNNNELLCGTDYEESFKELVSIILKNTREEYFKSPYIHFKKKFRFLFYWYCPNMARIYRRLVYGKI